MAMLEIKDLEVYYGVIQAIKGVSFEVNQDRRQRSREDHHFAYDHGTDRSKKRNGNF